MTITGALRGGLAMLRARFLLLAAATAGLLLTEAGVLVLDRLPAKTIAALGGVRALCFCALAVLVQVAGRAMLRPGVLLLQQRCMTGAPVSAGDVFRGLDRAGAMLKSQLLRTAVIGGAAAGALVPALALLSRIPIPPRWALLLAVAPCVVAAAGASIGTLFMDRVVCLEGLPPFRALGETWRLSIPHGAKLLVLGLVTTALETVSGVVGIAFFGVGVVFTTVVARTFTDAVFMCAYCQLRSRA